MDGLTPALAAMWHTKSMSWVSNIWWQAGRRGSPASGLVSREPIQGSRVTVGGQQRTIQKPPESARRRRDIRTQAATRSIYLRDESLVANVSLVEGVGARAVLVAEMGQVGCLELGVVVVVHLIDYYDGVSAREQVVFNWFVRKQKSERGG